VDHGERLALLPLGDEEAGALLASVPEEERTECWWVVLEDGTPVKGDGGGGVLLLREIGLTRPIGRVLGSVGLSPVVDLLDKLLARSRGHLSRFVPDGPAPRRFP
jgi:hypothetical protein